MTAELQSHLRMAAIDFPRLRAFVQNLRYWMNADAALFRYLDFHDGSYPLTITCGSALFGQKFFADYDGQWGMSDPHVRIGLNRELPAGSVYICSEHYSQSFRKRDPYFRDFLPKHNIQWMAGYLATVENQYGAGFALVRRTGREPFSEHDKRKLEPLAQMMEDSVRLLLQCQRAKLVQKATELALNRQAAFAVCMDAQRRILWCSRDAKSIFESLLSISMVDDKLVPKGRVRDHTLIQKMTETAKFLLSTPQTIDLSIKNGGTLPIELVPVKSEESEPDSFKACVLLGGAHKALIKGTQLNNNGIDNLTHTETEITRLMTKGMSAPQIAHALGVRPSTVRTHLKHIYRKLDINSKSELVAKYVRSLSKAAE